MNVLILTVGTRGDVQPYVALGKGLAAAGHHVTICTCPRFESFITEHGLGFAPLDEGLLELLESDLGRAIIENINGIFGALRTVPKVIKRVKPIQHRMVADAWQATVATAPDVILYHPKMFSAPVFAAKLGIPAILTTLYPFHVPTGVAPMMGFPRLPLGGPYNRSTYRIVQALTALGSRTYLNQWRRTHDPERRSAKAGVTRTAPDRPIPILHGFSPHVIPVPDDWPEHATASGYWFLNHAPKWTPPESLTAFLADGSPPIYVGFGSMAGRDPARTTEIVLAAIQASGVRAILATGWGGLKIESVPASVHLLERAPHDWLFPQVSAVIHHGGAGTTAAGLRAGRPTVICPFALDQPYWGQRVHQLGAGPKPIPQRKLTIENLTAAIEQVTTNDAIRRAADQIGHAIRAEDGIGNAVRTVEAIVRRSRRVDDGF